jgi:signal transduction histidine kinase
MAQLLHHPTGQYVVYISGVDTYGAVQVRQLRNLLILSWLGSIFVLFGLGWWFARKALVPVSRIVQQAQHIGVNNLQLRVPERTPRTLPGDELDQLARTFNDMLARLGVSFELQRRFVQNASHELNTPLTSIMGEIELALTRERPVAEYQQTLQSVYEEAERLSGITHALLTMARIEEHPLENTSEPIALAALVTEQVAYYRAHFPERTLEWLPPAGSDAWRIVASEALLRTAIRNVLDNALKYSQQAVQVQLERSPGTLRLRVQDRGIGIPTAEQQRILQPLYRASNAAGQVPGSGLGLSLVQRILELHGGELHLASEQGHGTTVELVWPDRS